MKYLLMFFTLVIGAMVPIQAILNTRLGKITGGPLMGSLLSFFTGFICLLVLNVATNHPAVLQAKDNVAGPWYIWLGGVIGAIFVGYITWVNQQQGVALTFALVVSGQIFMSLLADHYGMFGSVVQPLTLQKAAGAALIIAGLILIKK